MLPFSQFLFCIFFLVNCVAPANYIDYALAAAAVKATKGMLKTAENESIGSDSKLYVQSISYYRRGQISFRNKRYKEASTYFLRAKELAEQAERNTYIRTNIQQDTGYN